MQNYGVFHVRHKMLLELGSDKLFSNKLNLLVCTTNKNLCMQEENGTNKRSKLTEFQIHTKPTE